MEKERMVMGIYRCLTIAEAVSGIHTEIYL